ncbi:MAG: putative bifunctional diguanylate cyclase/phosphodiesterase, partial [Janthinobacterium lividum]
MPIPDQSRAGQPQHEVAADRLRTEQITLLARWSGSNALGSIVSCFLVVATFWATASHAYLLTLLLTLAIVHGAAILSSRIWLAKTVRVGTRRMLRVRIVITGIIGTVWATMPIMLMPRATPDQRQLVIYICSGLITASIMLAPLRPAALLLAVISSLGALLPMPLLDQTITPQHAAIVVLYCAMTCATILALNRDFNRRVLNELTLEEQGEIIGLLLRDFEENAGDWLWEVDAELRLHRVSDRLAQLLSSDQATLQGSWLPEWIRQGAEAAGLEEQDAPKLLAALTDRVAFRDLQILIVSGKEQRWFSVTGKPMLDASGTFKGYRGVGSDVTAARRSDKRITYLARYDSLTGLPNRTLFQETLRQACEESTAFALLYLDLDGFKAINDTLGHGMGDALLVAVAGRLRGCLREGDLVARLGGDEFAVLQMGDAAAADTLAQRLVRQVAEPYTLGGMAASVGLSIGIAMACDAGGRPEDLLKAADLALYHSKTEGRGTWHFFEAEMARRADARHVLQADLRRAIDRNELIVEFQPIIDLLTGNITGAEALVRWMHPERGRISPADFIPIAEESGLIVPLGAWVLRRACGEAATWSGQARVAVNLSPLQFRDPGLLALVDDVLAETGLAPQRLELEITESVFLDAVDTTLACLHALRERGIHIALDDFGTGYSSLSYLRSFPFDKVKIDQSFIRDLSVNEDAIAIVQAIVGMASSLGMRTTGEGVETQSQAQLLQLTGCSQVQGYLFGRPCASGAIASFMAA